MTNLNLRKVIYILPVLGRNGFKGMRLFDFVQFKERSGNEFVKERIGISFIFWWNMNDFFLRNI